MLDLCILRPIIDPHEVVSSLTNFNLTLMKMLEYIEGISEKTNRQTQGMLNLQMQRMQVRPLVGKRIHFEF
jgi:hypothetical protein